MEMNIVPASIRVEFVRYVGSAVVCGLMVAALAACTVGDEREPEPEAKVRSLEESVQALEDENAELKAEITVLRERLDVRDARIQELEEVAAKAELVLSDKDQWSKGKDEWRSLPEGDAVERTAMLVENSAGEVYYLDHAEREIRTVLALPQEFVDDETPLIVSLHGFGGDSAHQSGYVPLHERVNTDGFALLLPNGTPDIDGNRSWNPTDSPFTKNSGETGQDDVAYLTELIQEAMKVRDFGPVYFFGYSNGGFMSYHMACRGLPGLRAVASLSGTSYVEDSSCDGAHPVSVLHIHGDADDVILFEGDKSEPYTEGDGEPAFYAGAQDMVARWSRRAGCDWPGDPAPYAVLDLDKYVPGSETQAFRSESGCAEGISIELWTGMGSGHSPGYGDAFADALVDWLMAQE